MHYLVGKHIHTYLQLLHRRIESGENENVYDYCGFWKNTLLSEASPSRPPSSLGTWTSGTAQRVRMAMGKWIFVYTVIIVYDHCGRVEFKLSKSKSARSCALLFGDYGGWSVCATYLKAPPSALRWREVMYRILHLYALVIDRNLISSQPAKNAIIKHKYFLSEEKGYHERWGWECK